MNLWLIISYLAPLKIWKCDIKKNENSNDFCGMCLDRETEQHALNTWPRFKNRKSSYSSSFCPFALLLYFQLKVTILNRNQSFYNV
ncbi:unnamed protein product [Blepharisma stoltei]|uniref:Uncharacterized protein n=1 Tax=Blepharisma stoltei TaxID=1481888 RepID=A0AAU9IK90_9CILI|nr:unnamed protein product [Blepharisma stoltei]